MRSLAIRQTDRGAYSVIADGTEIADEIECVTIQLIAGEPPHVAIDYCDIEEFDLEVVTDS